MPFKYKKDDLVLYKGEPEFENLAGLYVIDEVGKDGTTYRITDPTGGYTDTDEQYIDPVSYAVFTRWSDVPGIHGWPIIVPNYLTELYNGMLNSDMYKFQFEGTAIEAIKFQTDILKKLEQATG